jgi:hypothetical protein
LNADFDALNGALYDDESIRHTSSTLSADERAELRTLSSSVSYAWLMLQAGLCIDARRRHMIQDAIVWPSYAISRFGLMALDLIVWYGGQLSCPVRAWKDTVLGMWETTNRTIPVLACRDLERNELMKAFRIAIQDCSLNYKAQRVLDAGFERCRIRQGIGELAEGGSYCIVRNGYRKLFENLKVGCIEPPVVEQCGRLENGRRNGCGCEAGRVEEFLQLLARP